MDDSSFKTKNNTNNKHKYHQRELPGNIWDQGEFEFLLKIKQGSNSGFFEPQMSIKKVL